MRDMLSFKDVMIHLTQPPLQLDAPPHVIAATLPLRANYLALLNMAFVQLSV